MRKIKFYVPVLAIVAAGFLFSTTSCVDDNESQSVTDLRVANADKLRAEAAFDEAQAEVAKIVAEAQAALTKAEAERALAEAAKLKAEADYETAKTAMEKAEAEQKLKEAQENLKKIEADVALAVEQAKNKLEIEKKEAEKKLIDLEVAIEKAKKDAQIAGLGNPVLDAAVGKYFELIEKLTDASEGLAEKELLLIEKKTELAVSETEKEFDVEIYKMKLGYEIATETKYNEKLKQSLADWKAVKAGTATVEKQIETKETALAALLEQRFDKNVDVKAKEAAVRNTQYAYYYFWSELMRINNSYKGITGNDYDVTISLEQTKIVLSVLEAKLAADKKLAADSTVNLSTAKALIPTYNTQLNDAISAHQDAVKAEKKAEEEMNAAELNYNNVKDNPASTEAQIKAALDAYEAKEKVFGAAEVTTGEAAKKEGDARSKYQQLINRVDELEWMIRDWQDSANGLENYSIPRIKDMIAQFGDDSNKLQTLRDAYDAAQRAHAAARAGMGDLENEIYLIKEDLRELKIILYNSELEYGYEFGGGMIYIDIDQIDGRIASIESDIQNSDKELALLKEQHNKKVLDANGAIEYDKAVIAKLESEIADQKERISVIKGETERAKKAMDDLLK